MTILFRSLRRKKSKSKDWAERLVSMINLLFLLQVFLLQVFWRRAFSQALF
ncbi:hypothetical protein IMCC14465_00790 [alpha proteobacterium IMCC14465]|uniref:Uncharacterized protein n=1 Tax=alpha proteobacterium IMCC14465 TaxID=1220535 RepID=J9A790_9PROT|nr:hypothetical protein IMCC14465_00790 [alpha proteobacterium IMCC14465]